MVTRQEVSNKYKTILGRNIYDQSRRTYVYTKYSDGNYYSDCSSSICYTYKECGLDIGNLNTAGIYNSTKGTLVDVDIKNGQISDISKLRVGDCLLFAGTDASRPKCIGHVEMVASISSDNKSATLYGHGSKVPREIDMYTYCMARFNFKTTTSVGNKGLVCVKRFIQDEENNSVSTITKGIDVSSYQGDIDWAKVKNDGVKFVVLRGMIKDGSLDKKFEANYKSCIAHNLPYSCYNYSYATTLSKFKSDAEALVKLLNGKKMTIWLDIEDDCQKTLGKTLIDGINAYYKVIQDAGLDFGIYTGLSFYNSYLRQYASDLPYKFWIARYYNGHNAMLFNTNPNDDYKPVGIANTLYAWQYTSSGIVNGVDGGCDLNILNTSTIETTTTVNYTNNGIENVVTADKLNIRKSANALPTTKIVSCLSSGDTVDIIGYTNGWYQISNGYVSSKYIKCKMGRVTASILNIRSIASKSGIDMGDLINGEIVNLLAENNGWYLIQIDNRFGWVSGQYIALR